MEKVRRCPAECLQTPRIFPIPVLHGSVKTLVSGSFGGAKIESRPLRLASPTLPFRLPTPPPHTSCPATTPPPPSAFPPSNARIRRLPAHLASAHFCSLTFRPAPGGGESQSARRQRSPPSDADGSLPAFSRVYAQWLVSKGLSTEAGVFDTTSAGSSLADTTIAGIPI